MHARVERCEWGDIPPEEEDYFGWGTDLFGVASYRLQWATPQWRFLVRLLDKPIVHVAVLRRIVTVGGQSEPVGGITRLITIPQQRNRGFATFTLYHAVHFVAEDLGLAFAMGFASDRMVPFYRQRGWHELDARIVIDQPDGKRLSPVAALVLPCGIEQWPPGEVDICGLPW
ncbi:MAG TPA: GNAT family N-acetyltransferase [Chloroflexota bacterium]|jgi:GNAT superfamily N-acetyltransferase